MPGCSARLARPIGVFRGSSLGSQTCLVGGGRRRAQELELSAQEPHGAPPSIKATPPLHFCAVSTFKSGSTLGETWR